VTEPGSSEASVGGGAAVRARFWGCAAALVAVVAVAGGVAAFVLWPSAHLGAPGEALARVVLPRFAGQVGAVTVHSADGKEVPVRLSDGMVMPQAAVGSGERVKVEITVRRPGWAAWLVGDTDHRIFTVETPTAHLLERWLQVKPGGRVTVAFDRPVSIVSLAGKPARTLPQPRRALPIGLTASGTHATGAVDVAVAARTWERPSAPVRVKWFPARPYPQLLAKPTPGSTIGPKRQFTLTFSKPVSEVLGSRRPRLSPALTGHWRLLDEHTLGYQPGGLGFGLGTDVRVDLPEAVHLAGPPGAALTRSLRWHVADGSSLRLQQLLAQLGYLPVTWTPSAAAVSSSVGAELVAARAPPPGQFSWRFRNTPKELRKLWRPGKARVITRGAVMMFQHRHGLVVDGLAGPVLWQALIRDAITGRRRTAGYSYVFVHRKLPQSLNLWHNGHVILRSPGNTGVPAAPTQLGTFAVFEHVPVGEMRGTNPDGSHYDDPGIRYISYFHGGDAIHAFTRSSFGTPQSLGCVELPLRAAAKVWPYTPIGTLVTVEN
jgi:peptidoglycan hydrolase-like protein with peptidoglycan-binding domain